MDYSVWDSLLHASLVVQLTLLTLAIMSVISWAIFFAKRKQLDTAEEGNTLFSDLFWKARSLDEVDEKADRFATSPIAKMFKSGFSELNRLADSKGDSTKTSVPKLTGSDNVARALTRSMDIEISNLEKRLSFLATTGSTAPFIGLFGTVWGIMSAFHNIGKTGAASLAVVAPGISEALVATAIGLAAAIPAVVTYNHFVARLKRIELQMSNFSSDFQNIVRRNFFVDEK
ncbi:MAG: protein TolQ [Bdellovibrionales bacterium CG10_big_fil_rev_8_21_14_0_10_45_34]|nr:MAG: protein TolQ [Bdellovibrionales bacterium CG10_big_fil_rev_8_21_14_0_10_45_34]